MIGESSVAAGASAASSATPAYRSHEIRVNTM
jgi:hypothetical protein